MKKSLFIFLSFCFTRILFAQHSLESKWQTDTLMKAPESVRYDLKAKMLYVSNIGEFGKEGTGSISKIGMDGKVITNNWVTGLSETKGLGLFNNLLYAAERSTVAVIDIDKGTVINRIPVEGAQMLNDVTVDAKGIVYVSDTKTGKVHRIEQGKASVYLENLKDANGLLAVGTDLYILADKKLQKADAAKKLTVITDGVEGGADGIEMISNNEFLVTGWEGIIYLVKMDGSKQTLLDTRQKKINSADLGYDPVSKTLFIPEMMQNKVVAYSLK